MSELATISLPQKANTTRSAANEVMTPGNAKDKLEERLQPFVIQPKLTVGAPDDPYEREADTVADKVMRMPERNFVQRKCAACKEEEKVQRQEADDEEELVQTKSEDSFWGSESKCEECKKEDEKPLPKAACEPTGAVAVQRKVLASGSSSFLQAKATGVSPVVPDTLEASIHASKGKGGGMDEPTKSFMQSRFQTGFGDVRIHADSSAAQMNKQLHAKAFTVGSNIYFNEGQYQPHTSEGKTLLAHELTHVVQQSNNQAFTQSVQRQEATAEAPVKGSVCDAYNKVDTATSPTEGSTTPEKPAVPATEAKPVAPPPTAKATDKTKQPTTVPAGKEAGSKTTEEPANGNKKDKLPADPAFHAVIAETHQKAKRQKDHKESADVKVHNAEEASKVKDGQAITLGATVLTVDEKVNAENQKPKEFKAAEFKQQLKEKISSGVPNEEESAKAFIKDDKQVNAITADTKNNVSNAQKEVVSDAKKIDSQNETNEDSKAQIFTRTGADYEAEQAGTKPVVAHAERAIPKPATDDELKMDEEHNADSLDKLMEKNNISDDQLAESEEPQFIETLKEKQHAQKELCQIPAKLKTAEQAQLQQSTGAAQYDLNSSMSGMYSNRDSQLKGVAKGQHDVQAEEELRLQQYYDKIKLIYATTDLNVKNSLNYLDCIVNCTFEDAITKAFDTFKENVTKRLDYYYDWHIVREDYEKEDKWTRAIINAPIDEKINGLEFRKNFFPPNSPERQQIQAKIDDLKTKRTKLKIEQIFEEEKALFINTMDVAIDKIADMVANGLNEAKAYISKGKAAVEDEYACLDETNKAKAKETTDDFKSKFDELNSKVDDKEADLTDALARKYNETASKLKDTFETIRKEAAKSWWEKAWEKIKEIATIIYNLGKTLLNILAKAAGVVGDIIRHPIRFFENLIDGIKTGFSNFIKRLPQHLEELVFKIIMGVVPAEITLPAQWDIKGIFSFVLEFLGLSKANIRQQAIDRFGEPVVEKLEQAFDLFVIFRNEGFAGLWEYIKEKIGDLKDAIIEEVKTFFEESIIKAAVEFIISALTPASGFIKVCKSIIDIVLFLVKNLQNLLKLLDNILDSLADIAVGKIDKAALKVENAITDILVIGIKFLAALIGINLDKIQAKISKVINAVRNPVNRALKWLFDKAEAFAEKTGLLRLIRKGQEKFEAGKEWAKDKIEQGKEKISSGVKRVIKAFDWGKTRKSFKAQDGKTHSLYVEKRGGRPVLIVESDPTLLSSLLAQLRTKYKKDNAKLATISRTEELMKLVDQYAVAIKTAEERKQSMNDDVAKQRIQNEIETAYDTMIALETSLTTNLHELLEKEDYSELSSIYAVEGLVGVHADAPKRKNMFEADHQPSNKMIQTAASFADAPPILQQIATSRSSWASTITLQKKRHTKGRTYGSKAKPIARQFVDDLKRDLSGATNQRDGQRFIEVQLQKQAKADAQFMLDKVRSTPVTDDLWSDINGQPKAEELREKIVSQIEQGESLIINQKVTIPLNLP